MGARARAGELEARAIGDAAEGLRSLSSDGERAIDVADASGTLMLDVAQRRVVRRSARSRRESIRRCCPTLYESPKSADEVSDEGAEATGLRAGTPVVAGAGDQAAGAVGMGIVRPGAVSATIGTSGVVFAATDRRRRSIREGAHPHVLPRDSRPMARDGRHPGGRSFAALVPR